MLPVTIDIDEAEDAAVHRQLSVCCGVSSFAPEHGEDLLWFVTTDSLFQPEERLSNEVYVRLVVLSRNELPITDTLLKLIATAAIIGLSSSPMMG